MDYRFARLQSDVLWRWRLTVQLVMWLGPT
jgi:hypothetical protein